MIILAGILVYCLLEIWLYCYTKWTWNNGICRKCLYHRIPQTYYPIEGYVTYNCKCLEHGADVTSYSRFYNYEYLREYAVDLYILGIADIYVPSMIDFRGK